MESFYLIQKKTFQTIDIRSQTHPSNEALFIYEDRLGELWAMSNDPGVVRINLETGEKQHLFTPKKEVFHYRKDHDNVIFEDVQGNLWLTPYKGNFCYYDRKEKCLKPYYIDPNNPQSLFSPLVRRFYEDRQRNIWIADTRGIHRMSFNSQVYSLNRIDPGLEIRAFFTDPHKRLWVASKSGYIRIYEMDGTLSGYLTPEGVISKNKTSFSSNVYSFCEDEEGNLWLGTKENGIFMLSPKTKDSYTIRHYIHHPEDKYSLSHNDIFIIFADSRKNIWIGCYGGGLNLVKKDNQGKVFFINNKNELKNYPNNTAHNIRHITEIDSVILVATTNGLITFSNHFVQPEEIAFYHNRQKTESTHCMIGSDIMYICRDSNKDIYVLTFTGGVNKIQSKDLLNENIEFKVYTSEQGLGSDLVMSMIEDEDNNLWIVSENTLNKFNSKTESFENYNAKFFQHPMNFTEAPPVINAKKQLILGTDQGFLEVCPERMKKSSYIAPIVLTDIRINGSPIETPLDDLNEIILEPLERNISVDFSALDYVRPEDIQYAYRVEGFEKEWNYSGKNRSASYINLPAGEYRLLIKSTNSDGVWVNNMRTLAIKVVPTFWETLWAWLVYLLAFMVFTTAIVYVLFYIYRLRHEVDMEHQLSNIKLRFFTDISHELRTPLTLISTPVTEVLENEPLSTTAREHLTLVHKNTDRMLRLVNQILDFRKIQNKKMKILAEETELITFTEKVTESFKMVAAEKQIDFRIETEINELYIWIDRDKVEKIIFNLLSNAFKYTLPKKSVKVRIKKDDEKVFIHVMDEGIGIAKEKQESLFQRFETIASHNTILQPSSGIGLSLVKELVELHHGNINVKSQAGIGSDFYVTLPLDRAVLEKDSQVELILSDSLAPEIKTIFNPITQQIPVEENQDSQERLSILIVEDNQELKRLIKNILLKKYVILEAENGEEGLELALKNIPDLIISDVMMPVMDGLEMIRQIKDNKDICHIPIILLSAKSSLDDRIIGLEQGVDDYITKPFSSTYLKARIDSLFAQRKQLQEIFINRLSIDANRPIANQNWEPSKPEVMPHDESFMQQVMAFMEEQMDNPDLIIDDFANKLLMSRSIFYRKLKSIVGVTPVDFIGEIRVKRAAQLIESDMYNFSQIAYMTGFSDPKYFSKCFKKHMGMTPSEYKNSLSNKVRP